MLVSSRGLGWAATDGVPGYNNACGASYFEYIFNPNCWGSSFSDWQTAFNGQPLATTLFGSCTNPPCASGGAGDACQIATGITCTTWILGALGIVLLVKL